MTDKPVGTKVILLRESALQSWLSDASTLALFIALIGVGWFLASEAMQWVGAIIGFFTIIRNAEKFAKARTFSIPDARAELDRLEKLS